MASSADSSASATGFVIRFYDNKGYGFIKPDSSASDDEDLFVHYTGINQSEGYRTLQEGQKVKFSVSVKDDKKQAVNVTALDVGSNVVDNRRRRDSGRDGSRDGGRRSGFRGSGNGVRNIDGVECYNCGGVGHYSRDCSSDVMVRSVGRCFTCNGLGHIARDCTRDPVSVGGGRGGRGCFNCGVEGHLARDCTDVSVEGGRVSRGECFKCHEVGHMARDCTNEGGRAVRRGNNDGGFGQGCYNCGQMGHIARNCHDPVTGHVMDGYRGDDEGKNRSGGGDRGCFNCHKTGHFARECPTAAK